MSLQHNQLEQTANNKIAVVKFGSSILTSSNEIPQVIHEVYQYLRYGYKVLAVVSALSDATNKLIKITKQLLDDENIAAPNHEFSELLATGETVSASLFTIGLDRAGIKAKKLDHRCVRTQGSSLNADPVSLDTESILNLFQHYSVLVIPGFLGCNEQENLTLLGRGGSDFTAIFSAWALNANQCVIYKDTDGIYNLDPNVHENEAQRYKFLSYIDALKIPSGVIQHKALKFAQSKKICFSVKSLSSVNSSWIGAEQTLFAPEISSRPKLRITLLGLGTVGFGVYQYLLANQHLFEIVGIAVKDLEKHARDHVSPHLISHNLQEIISRDCDVVIELIGGIEIPNLVITDSIKKRRHIITANKALLAKNGLQLEQLATSHQVKFYYSAAVAGAIPILEILQNNKNIWQKIPIASITCILNRTCNFILEKVKEGKTFSDAIKLAKFLGFAESDPTLDISGQDAADKIVLISRAAFNREPDILTVTGVQHLTEKTIRDAVSEGKSVKLVASCGYENGVIRAEVKPIVLDSIHPLANISVANNAVLIQLADKQVIQLHGKGAGRWPTSQAVFADLWDLSQCHRNNALPLQQQREALTNSIEGNL